MVKILKSLIKPFLGVAIIYLLVRNGLVDLQIIGSSFVRHPWVLASAVLVLFGLSSIAGWRWFLLLKAGGIHLPFGRIFSLHMIGLFFVTLIPGGTGGDLVKGYYLYKGVEKNKNIAISSIVVDRVLGLYGMLLWGCTGCLLNIEIIMRNPELKAYFFFYLALFVGVTIVLGSCFMPWAENLFNHSLLRKLPGQAIIQGWSEAFKVYRRRRGILWFSLLLTLVVHGSIIVVYTLCTLGIDVSLSLREQSMVVPLMTLINGLPLSPGGIGVGEAGGVFLYRFLDVSQGGEILMVFHLLFFINALFGAPFYFFYRSKSKERAS